MSQQLSRSARSARLALAAAVGLCLLSMGPRGLANGAYSHVHISQLALPHIADDGLRAMLERPECLAAFESGSMFPDLGYAVEPHYEIAHWCPFQNAYLDHLLADTGGDYSSEESCRRAAFILGAMSHSLADQVYDTTLLERALYVNPETGGVSADEVADYFIVVDQNVHLSVAGDGPFEEISRVLLDRLGADLPADHMQSGMARMQSVIFLQDLLGPGRYLEAWQAFPWLGTYIYDPAVAGSLPHLGVVVAAHLDAAWKRLTGTADLDTDLVSATVPLAGSVNLPVDADPNGDPYRRIGLVFSWGVSRAQVTPLLSFAKADGTAEPFRVRTPYGGDLRNYLMIEPLGTLAYDTEYVVTVALGVQTLNGDVSGAPYEFRFRTRCAPDRIGDCPPLPGEWVADEIPTEGPTPPQPDVVEPGPDVVEPTPDVVEPTPDVVEPTPDVVEPAQDVVEPGEDLVGPDAATPDAEADVMADVGATVPDTGAATLDAAAAPDTGGDSGGRGGGCAPTSRVPAGGFLVVLLLLALGLRRALRPSVAPRP